MYLEKAKEKIKDLHDFEDKQVIPCTREEVEALEQWIGHRLPEAYREFLFWVGHSGGTLLEGSHCFYPDLKDLQSDALYLLEEEDHSAAKLPEDAFVFLMHQGYVFDFFRLSEGDDPPVYQYAEQNPVQNTFKQTYPCFSNFLFAVIENEIKIERSMESRKAARQRREQLIRERNQQFQREHNRQNE